MSHNLLKQGAQRRRTKAEIQQARLEEQERLRDIEIKMQRFDEMEQEMAMLRERQNVVARAEDAVDRLNESGFIRFHADGSFSAARDWNEHQQIVQQRQQEAAEVQRLEQENQQIQQNQPHQERRRAGNQLEAIIDFNANQERQPPIKLSNSGLSESMVIVGGA